MYTIVASKVPMAPGRAGMEEATKMVTSSSSTAWARERFMSMPQATIHPLIPRTTHWDRLTAREANSRVFSCSNSAIEAEKMVIAGYH